MTARLVVRLLEQLARDTNGRRVDQLTHSLQAATRAVRAGADDDLVVAALCHDIGKVLSWTGHAKVSAACLTPFLDSTSAAIVAVHHDFLAIYNTNRSALDPMKLRTRHEHEPWFVTATVFADEWDIRAYEPRARPKPLEYFVPVLERIFARQPRKANGVIGIASLYRRAQRAAASRRLQ